MSEFGFGFLTTKTPGTQIELIDPGNPRGDRLFESLTDCARVLEGLDRYLGEYEEDIFPCKCEDGDERRGSWESDTGAYNHLQECMQGSYYHYHRFLAGVAQYLRSIDKTGGPA